MTATLVDCQPVTLIGERSPGERDKVELAELMMAAYQGTADDHGEKLDQALVEIENTFSGEYGPFMPQFSRVIERNDRLVSATLVTSWKGRPFIAFAMTHPDWKRQGLARASMVNAMHLLHAHGQQLLSLVVTVKNEPAYRLYQSLGFRSGR